MESSAAVDLCFYLPSAAATHTTHYPLPTTSPISAVSDVSVVFGVLSGYSLFRRTESRKRECECEYESECEL